MESHLSATERKPNDFELYPPSIKEDSLTAQNPAEGSSGGYKVEIAASSPLRSALKSSTSVASLKSDSPFRNIKWADKSDTITPPSSDEAEDDVLKEISSKEKNPIIQSFIDRHFAAKENKKFYYEKMIECIRAEKDTASRAWNAASFAANEEISITREASRHLIKANKKLKEQPISASSIADLDTPPAEKTLKNASPIAYVLSSAADAAHAMTVGRVRLAEATEQNEPNLSELSTESERIDNVAYHWLDAAHSMRQMLHFKKEARRETQDGNIDSTTALTQKTTTAQQRTKLLTQAAIAFEKGDESKATELKERAKRLR